MAQDFFIDPITNDWFLVDGTTIRLCETVEELTRQRIYITLKTFLGEWFANITFGTPYFQSIFGKNDLSTTDAVFKSVIRSIEGVVSILSYTSEIDKETRKYSATFSVNSESGVIPDIQI